MSLKKSSAQAHHENAKRTYAVITRGTDKNVAGAVRQFWDAADKINSDGKFGLSLRNMFPLLEEHVDSAISNWLKKYTDDPVKFSHLMRTQGNDGPQYFRRLYKQFSRERGAEWVNIESDLTQTASTLLDLGSYCMCHGSDYEEIVEVKTYTGNRQCDVQVVQNQKQKQRESAKKLPFPASSLDFKLLNFSQQYCQLCPNLTEASEEMFYLTRDPVGRLKLSDDNRKKLLSTKLRIRFDGKSDYYCETHKSKVGDNAAYSKAHRSRHTYYAMYKFLILARDSFPELPPCDRHILRASSFLIVDACKDKKLLKEMVQYTYEWHTSWKGGGQPNPTLIKICETVKQIIAHLAGANAGLATLTEAIYRKDGEFIYEAAKLTGALPDRIEGMLEEGFLHTFLLALSKMPHVIYDPAEEKLYSIAPPEPD